MSPDRQVQLAMRPLHPAFASGKPTRILPGLPGSLIFAALLAQGAIAQVKVGDPASPWSIDFRYAPPWWQTAICLPDDWQKTLVGKEGCLLYDYPGPLSGFATRITFGLATNTQWTGQELVSPRVPIVRTQKRGGDVEVLEEAFAVVESLQTNSSKVKPDFLVERVGADTGQVNWAQPGAAFDPAFRNVAIGWAQPIQYRFKVRANARYSVVFGICEGHHERSGQRRFDLQIEGKTRQTVDSVTEKGKNAPALYALDAQDENGDGWIDLAVGAAEGSPDRNTILNVLWVFPQGQTPPLETLLAGQSPWPPMAHVDCGADPGGGHAPRHDVLLARLKNTGTNQVKVAPTLTLESAAPISSDATSQQVKIGPQTVLFAAQPWESVETGPNRLLLRFPETSIGPGKEQSLAFGVGRGRNPAVFPRRLGQVETARASVRRYWENLDLPYDRLVVPDDGVQALLDSAVRNIYQAREIKNGLPAFQVGPTCYRGLWVVDGSFLLEAITFLGRTNETRNGVKYLMSFQRPDGGFMLIDGHWKETGIALWAITRHARLTGDPNWLREVWPQVERGFAHIRKMRQMPAADAPNARLIPDGFSDGGLADRVPEYTNIYWTLAGMRAAIEAARWLGFGLQAHAWQQEYDDFYQTFRRAAERDQRADAHGNRYVPIRMVYDQSIPPQKAQWAFLHAVFPGKVFAADDPLVRGNMAMLREVETQDLVLDTGWLKNGIWNYFASFYGHAWLWLGPGAKAAQTLYAFGNHASPLLVWREEQMPVGQGGGTVGDMPHNWASAEFIRLTRHSLALERGTELHLFEAMPAKWARAGARVRLRQVLTDFGPLSLDFVVSKDGRTATLNLEPPRRSPPDRIVLHLDTWSHQKGTLDLPTQRPSKQRLKL